jgi:hypothetical protein
MNEQLTALYLTNAVLLTLHEIDSAYWREWELLRLPGGRRTFLLLHLPLLGAVLFGLLLVDDGATAGYVFSLLLGSSGVLAFALHMSFIAWGRPEFRERVSISVLVLTLGVSLAQCALTIIEWW